MKRVQRPARDKQPPSSTSPAAEKNAPRPPRKVSASKPATSTQKPATSSQKPATSTQKPRVQTGASRQAQPTQAAPKKSTPPAPKQPTQPASAAAARPEAETTKPVETTAKRHRRGLGTLGLSSLQRHLPTFTLAVERPRPWNSAAEAAGPLPALSTRSAVAQGCVDRTDLLLLRDGLHKLLALLDAPPPLAQEM